MVVFPTETFYGLAVDPTQPDAVAAVFDLKGRPAGLALPLVAASVDAGGAASSAGSATPMRGWPPSSGPVRSRSCLDAPAAIAPAVHGGTQTVAVRVPAHPTARALAEACGHPLTATSANRTGEPAAADVAGIAAIAADRRVLVLDAGRTPGGRPSTIVDARVTPVRIIRTAPCRQTAC